MPRKIIDVHHHVFPKNAPPHPWDIETDNRDMDILGIDSVLLSSPMPVTSDTAHRANLNMMEQCKYNQARYRFLATIPYDDTAAALEEIAFAYNELGAAGIGINTQSYGVYIGDDSLDPVFEELNHRNAVILLHPSPPRENPIYRSSSHISVYEYPFDTTRAMMDFIYKRKFERYPNITWILPHAGGTIPFLAHRLSMAKDWKGIDMLEDEVLACLKNIYYELAISASPDVMSMLKNFVGADQILFGSDYPACSNQHISCEIAAIDAFGNCTEEEKIMIFSSNAERLLRKLRYQNAE